MPHLHEDKIKLMKFFIPISYVLIFLVLVFLGIFQPDQQTILKISMLYIFIVAVFLLFHILLLLIAEYRFWKNEAQVSDIDILNGHIKEWPAIWEVPIWFAMEYSPVLSLNIGFILLVLSFYDIVDSELSYGVYIFSWLLFVIGFYATIKKLFSKSTIDART